MAILYFIGHLPQALKGGLALYLYSTYIVPVHHLRNIQGIPLDCQDKDESFPLILCQKEMCK